eukprot:3416769-Pyramimonas_sp.AAC.1
MCCAGGRWPHCHSGGGGGGEGGGGGGGREEEVEGATLRTAGLSRTRCYRRPACLPRMAGGAAYETKVVRWPAPSAVCGGAAAQVRAG